MNKTTVPTEQACENPHISTPKKMRKPAAQNAFLESFAQHGIVTRACKDAGIDRSTVYLWKEHDDTFLVRYNLALEEAKDAIREEIRRRAHDGWDEKVYQMGVYAGTVHKYSDLLLIFHAKALMAEYREKQQIEHSGSIAGIGVYLPQKDERGGDVHADSTNHA